MSRFQVENMKCNGCVAAVRGALEKLEGIESVEVSLESKTAEVTGRVDIAAVEKALTELGYPAKLIS